MLHVTSLQVRSYDLDHLDLFWEIPAVEDVIADYSFYIERCVDGGAGPFEQLAGPFINTFMFRDSTVRMLHKWRTYFYRVRVVNKSTGDEQVTPPTCLQAEPDLIAMEIRRRETLLFQEYAGRLVVLFPRLTFGQRCPNCWDHNAKGNYIGRAKQQNCITCYDTTFVGGYATPMLVWAQIDPTAKGVQPADIGEQVPVETTGRALWFPPLKPKDMIVEAENKRWALKTVTTTEKLRAAIRQELTMREHPRDDIRYKIPVNVELTRQMTPKREFKRQMDLQEDFPTPEGKVWIK